MKQERLNMKQMQIEANRDLGDAEDNNSLLRAAGVKRIHDGWYTVIYSGVRLDSSAVIIAKRNKSGLIK